MFEPIPEKTCHVILDFVVVVVVVCVFSCLLLMLFIYLLFFFLQVPSSPRRDVIPSIQKRVTDLVRTGKVGQLMRNAKLVDAPKAPPALSRVPAADDEPVVGPQPQPPAVPLHTKTPQVFIDNYLRRAQFYETLVHTHTHSLSLSLTHTHTHTHAFQSISNFRSSSASHFFA